MTNIDVGTICIAHGEPSRGPWMLDGRGPPPWMLCFVSQCHMQRYAREMCVNGITAVRAADQRSTAGDAMLRGLQSLSCSPYLTFRTLPTWRSGTVVALGDQGTVCAQWDIKVGWRSVTGIETDVHGRV